MVIMYQVLIWTHVKQFEMKTVIVLISQMNKLSNGMVTSLAL